MKLFDERDFEELDYLERLTKVLDILHDGQMVHRLYRMQGKGRSDWPCEAMWNSFIACFLLEHEMLESLLRELWMSELPHSQAYRPAPCGVKGW